MVQKIALWLAAWLSIGHACSLTTGEELAGVRVTIVGPHDNATLRLESTGRHRLQIVVDADEEEDSRPLRLQIHLPISGRQAWPVEDVEVLDEQRSPVARRHPGVGWEKFTIDIPACNSRYLVQTVTTAAKLRRYPESARQVSDRTTGISVQVARWFNDRRAALCIRFDDSHPSHLTTVAPLLEQYRVRATFMINPGARDQNSSPRWRSEYRAHQTAWEQLAQTGKHEFANHTSHHRGAADDEQMDREIGDAAKAIWDLFPGRSKLLALNLGGGTWWHTTRPLSHYLGKYPSFVVTGSLGMDDSYGNRVAAFRQHLERNLHGGLGWCKVHFHSVGPNLASSIANFRAVLDIVREHRKSLWVTGLSDAYQYLVERQSSKLDIESTDGNTATIKLTCVTDEKLFQQPLTIAVRLPSAWKNATIVGDTGSSMPTRTITRDESRFLLFDVPPVTRRWTISRRP